MEDSSVCEREASGGSERSQAFTADDDPLAADAFKEADADKQVDAYNSADSCTMAEACKEADAYNSADACKAAEAFRTDDAPTAADAGKVSGAADASEAADDDVVVVFAGTPAVVPGTPRTPKHPRPPPVFSRTLSMDPSVYGARNTAMSGASLTREKPPPSYEDVVKEKEEYQQSVRAPSVWLKIAQFVLAVLCLVLISDGYRLEVSQNVTAMHFPFIVFSAYTLITGVIIFSYVMGMKMRELLIRIFGTMGALLFLISGIHTANRTVVFWEHWQFTYEEGDTEENPDFEVATIPRRRVCFVAQVALSFLASAVYLGDVVYSYCRTTQMLN